MEASRGGMIREGVNNNPVASGREQGLEGELDRKKVEQSV